MEVLCGNSSPALKGLEVTFNNVSVASGIFLRTSIQVFFTVALVLTVYSTLYSQGLLNFLIGQPQAATVFSGPCSLFQSTLMLRTIATA